MQQIIRRASELMIIGRGRPASSDEQDIPATLDRRPPDRLFQPPAHPVPHYGDPSPLAHHKAEARRVHLVGHGLEHEETVRPSWALPTNQGEAVTAGKAPLFLHPGAAATTLPAGAGL